VQERAGGEVKAGPLRFREANNESVGGGGVEDMININIV
jgi:hypothetical protein